MIDSRLSLQTAISLTPLRAGLVANQINFVDVLVRVQAPDAVEVPGSAARPPQAIALVIDRSGSMNGRPLDEAKRCAEYVVGKMRPADSASLVEFDSRVRRLWPAVPIGDGVALRAAIGSIDCGGHTNLHGGWKEGADSLGDVAGQGLKRVILLSDGQANQGLTDPEAISAQCAEWAAKGITTSTYGLGRGFNEDLMVAMARGGGGNHYYGDTAEDLMEPFEQELELLGNLCMRNLRLSVSALKGAAVHIVNQLPEVDGGWPEMEIGPMKKRYTEEQFIGFLREADAGLPIEELCRKHGFSEASYYGWKAKFGGMNVSDAQRLKALEAENGKLKLLLANSSIHG